MDDDSDPNVSGGGSRGSTSLPKFNHLYPILFFSHFIRFCGANKCGGPLSSPDGRIESIVTLEDSHAVEEAEMPTPSRASVAADGGSTPQPRGGCGRGGRPPRPSDVDDESYRAATQEARDKKAIAGHLSPFVGQRIRCPARIDCRARKLNMPGYVQQLLKRTKMEGCNAVKSPAEAKLRLSRSDPPAQDGGLILSLIHI